MSFAVAKETTAFMPTAMTLRSTVVPAETTSTSRMTAM